MGSCSPIQPVNMWKLGILRAEFKTYNIADSNEWGVPFIKMVSEGTSIHVIRLESKR